MSGHVLVMTTVPSVEDGKRIAMALVERRLAACVNMSSPLWSVYRWQGKIEQSDERLLFIKTLAENLPRIEEALKTLHAYDLPEVIVLPIVAGSETYLNWISAQSSGEATES